MGFKKKIIGMLAVSALSLLLVGGVGCTLEEEPTVINAYDIAVKNGFKGTEEEWLRSLHGANGKDGEDAESFTLEELYAAAVENGYEGTMADFCIAVGKEDAPESAPARISENIRSVVNVYGYYTTSAMKKGAQRGSGVIVDLYNKESGSALIITNYHVVHNEKSVSGGIVDEITVYPYGAYDCFYANHDSNPKNDEKDDGVTATFVGGAMEYDIAILRVEGSEYIQKNPVVEAVWGNSEETQVGEEVYAIGNPLGNGISVTNGIVSVDSERIGMASIANPLVSATYRVMRISAMINGGNSGGGLFNKQGELIGIVNAKTVWAPEADGEISHDGKGTPAEGMGYALPIAQVKGVYDNILANEGKLLRATLGIVTYISDSRMVLNEDGSVGLEEKFQIEEVSSTSYFYDAFKIGDVFLSVKIGNAQTVNLTRQHQLTDLLLTVRKGDRVAFTVRGTNKTERTVTLLFDGEEYFLHVA